LDTDAFMRAIAGANCNDDVIGRGETCDGAADLNLSFLGTEADSSGNNRGIRKHGDTVLMPTGVHFDGDGDYFTVHTWDYALDATFSISVWMVKEECTTGLYEYLYSHQTDDTVGTDQIAEGGVQNAFVMFYIGCEGQGGVTSNLQGAVMRYWISDDSGTFGPRLPTFKPPLVSQRTTTGYRSLLGSSDSPILSRTRQTQTLGISLRH
jgi:hypothetical protein